jgi:hypothetical protein
MLGLNSFAFATVNDVEDLSTEMSKIQNLNNTSFNTFFNRSEVIGTALSNFNIKTSEFKLQNKRTLESLRKIKENIESIENSDEFSDSDKEVKITELIQNANQEIDQTGGYATEYLAKVRYTLPTLTYQRFEKQFIDYYNSLDINGSYIQY